MTTTDNLRGPELNREISKLLSLLSNEAYDKGEGYRILYKRGGEKSAELQDSMHNAYARKNYIDGLVAALAAPDSGEVVLDIEWPEYHQSAMGCGLEDRGISDRYEAMQYGWDMCLERCQEALDGLSLSSASVECEAGRYRWLEGQIGALKSSRFEAVMELLGLDARKDDGEFTELCEEIDRQLMVLVEAEPEVKS